MDFIKNIASSPLKTFGLNFLMSFLWLLNGINATGQIGYSESTPAYKKASYIYNFAKLIDWPQDCKKGAFTVGYFGDTTTFAQIADFLMSKRIGRQQVEVIFQPGKETISRCNIVYVDGQKTNLLIEVSHVIENASVLLISNCSDGLELGSAINFITKEKHLRFELDVAQAKTKELFIGSTLKALAYRIKE